MSGALVRIAGPCDIDRLASIASVEAAATDTFVEIRHESDGRRLAWRPVCAHATPLPSRSCCNSILAVFIGSPAASAAWVSSSRKTSSHAARVASFSAVAAKRRTHPLTRNSTSFARRAPMFATCLAMFPTAPRVEKLVATVESTLRAAEGRHPCRRTARRRLHLRRRPGAHRARARAEGHGHAEHRRRHGASRSVLHGALLVGCLRLRQCRPGRLCRRQCLHGCFRRAPRGAGCARRTARHHARHCLAAVGRGRHDRRSSVPGGHAPPLRHRAVAVRRRRRRAVAAVVRSRGAALRRAARRPDAHRGVPGERRRCARRTRGEASRGAVRPGRRPSGSDHRIPEGAAGRRDADRPVAHPRRRPVGGVRPRLHHHHRCHEPA